jgi:hypothetical protein
MKVDLTNGELRAIWLCLGNALCGDEEDLTGVVGNDPRQHESARSAAEKISLAISDHQSNERDS